MLIRGREIKFLRTVKATTDLVEMSPDKDLSRIAEIFSDEDVSSTLKNGAKLIHILNEGYEMNKAFNEDGYEPKIISVDEILYLSDVEYTELLKEAMNSMKANTTIETEKPKKKVKENQ